MTESPAVSALNVDVKRGRLRNARPSPRCATGTLKGSPAKADPVRSKVLREGSWQTIRQLRFTSGRGGRGVANVALRLRTPASYRFRVSVSTQVGLRYTRGMSSHRVVRVR